MPHPNPYGRSTPESTPPRRPRRSRRPLLTALCILAFLAAAACVFHAPLLRATAHLLLKTAAARQHLILEADLSGDPLRACSIENLRIRPMPGARTALESVDIARVDLLVNLRALLLKGPGEALERITLRDAYLSYQSIPPTQRPPRKYTTAQEVDRFLARPGAYADRVQIDNFNLLFKHLEGQTRIEGASLHLDPQTPGELRFKTLQFPRTPAWTHLHAPVSYRDRHLVIERMELAPDIILEDAGIDASERNAHLGSVHLRLNAFGGSVRLNLQGKNVGHRSSTHSALHDTVLNIEATKVSMDAATTYLGLPPLPFDSVERLTASCSGDPEKPNTWRGSGTTELAPWRAGWLQFNRLAGAFDWHDGAARFQVTNQEPAENRVTWTGTATLPAAVREMRSTEITSSLTADCALFPRLLRSADPQATGTATGTGQLTLKDQRLQTSLSLHIGSFENRSVHFASGSMELAYHRTLKRDASPGPASSELSLSAAVSELRHDQLHAEHASLDLQRSGGLLDIRKLEVAAGGNRLTAKGNATLPESSQTWRDVPATLDFSLEAPTIESSGLAWKDAPVLGSVRAQAHLTQEATILRGELAMDGTLLEVAGVPIAAATLKARFADGLALLDQCVLQFNPRDRIALMGKTALKAPFPLEGGAIASISDLSLLDPLLAHLGREERLRGKLEFDWNGKHELQPAGSITQNGDLSFNLTKAAIGSTAIDQFKLSAVYGNDFAEAKEFHVQSGKTQLDAALEFREGRLRIRDIALQQGALKVLTGYLLLPFEWTTQHSPFPLDQRLAANLNATDLDLQPLLSSFGRQAPLSGTLSANVVVAGTLGEPMGHLKLTARKLNATDGPKLDPAEADIKLDYDHNKLDLKATLRHPLLRPLTLTGSSPFNLQSYLSEKQIDPALPLDFSLSLPSSPLSVLPKLFPAIRRADGQAGLNVHLGGTFSAPLIEGSLEADVQSARLKADAAPLIENARARLLFRKDALEITTLRGELGGGSFDLGGRIGLKNPRRPDFALRLRAKDVLVQRDDSITVRVDSDLQLDGPWESALTKGSVWLTNSRFFKDIEILPIGLPGRPKPKPRTAPRQRPFSLTTEPLQDWKFDVAIKTRPQDPFRVRGNLANGGAQLDLRLIGTGENPELSGTVHVDNFVASLPFSRLNLTQGFLYFNAQSGTDPYLDLQAESALRDYRIFAYIYGRASDPRVSLSSEPPLPQADIASLLATGTTTAELSGRSDVLAGRAAVLVFQQLYRKVFKQHEPSEIIPLLERFELNMGAVDQHTGKQELSARFKLGKQLYLTGDVDVDGNFNGRLRYLLRFR